jgi:hypothetical protein
MSLKIFGGHLAGVAEEPGVALGLLCVARLIAGNDDPLQEVAACLGQEDDRLGRLALGEEEPPVPAVARLPLEQFQVVRVTPG